MTYTEEKFKKASLTDLEKSKFSIDSQGNVCVNTIPEGASNQQSDWNQTDASQKTFIKNKPTTITAAERSKLRNAPSDTSAALSNKVNKESGKGLSKNDYTDAEKTKVSKVPNDTNAALNNKVNKESGKGLSENDYTDVDKAKVVNVPNDTNTELAGKVNKESGKGLSKNDYTDADKTKVSKVPNDTNAALNNKVNKQSGKGLSENDYTDAEKTKLANVPNDTNAALSGKLNKTDKATSNEIKAGADNSKFITSKGLKDAGVLGGGGGGDTYKFTAGGDLQKYDPIKINNDFTIQKEDTFANMEGITLEAISNGNIGKVVLKGTIYSDANFNFQNKNDNLIYNKDKNTYTQKANYPLGNIESLAGARLDDDKAIFYGGNLTGRSRAETYLYSKQSNAFTQKVNGNRMFAHLGLEIDNNRCLFIGGQDTYNYYSSYNNNMLYTLSSNSYNSKSSYPTRIAYSAGASFDINNKLIVGGVTTSYNNNLTNRTYLYNFSNNNFTQKANYFSNICKLSGASIDTDKALFYGGQTSSSYRDITDKMYLYSKSNNTFTEKQSDIQIREHQLVKMNSNQVIIIGGRNSNNNTFRSNMLYTLSSNSYVYKRAYPTNISNFPGVKFLDNEAFFVGGYTGSGTIRTTYLYELYTSIIIGNSINRNTIKVL